MNRITLEHILQLHVMAIERYGGSDGLRDLGRLESAIATQTQEVFGQELYETAFAKAAALARAIVADHPFQDGNKRTAMLVATVFLQVNGFRFVAGQGALEDFAVKIAVDHLDVPAIARWLEANTN